MVEYLLTAVFVADIFVSLNVAYINAEGRIVMCRKAIATQYLKCDWCLRNSLKELQVHVLDRSDWSDSSQHDN